MLNAKIRLTVTFWEAFGNAIREWFEEDFNYNYIQNVYFFTKN